MTKLWDEYIKTKSKEIRNELVKEYINFVGYLVQRILPQIPRGMEREDVMQIGICGLIQAIERFDPKQGAKFETYASIKIQGAIIDQLRIFGKMNGGLSRSALAKSKMIDEAIKDLEGELKRSPSSMEVADKLSLSIDEYNKMLGEISIAIPVSLDDMVGVDDNLSVVQVIKNEDSVVPEEKVILDEQNELLGKSIDDLPEKEKIIIMLYYYEEMTLKEIGTYLNLSESRISQIHAEALKKLNAKMERAMKR